MQSSTPSTRDDGEESIDPELEFLCGGAAGIINVIVMFPVYKTVFFQQLHGHTWPRAALHLFDGNLLHIYRGILPPLLQRSCNGAIMFGAQGQSELHLRQHSPYLSVMQLKTASAIYAGISEAFLMPFERIQTVLQNRQYTLTYKNTFHTAKTLVQNHGFKELYRGLTPVVLRNCIGNVLYFCGREKVHQLRADGLEWPPNSPKLNDFLAGGVLGAVISALLFPMNVAKAHMQSQIGTPYSNLPRTLYSLTSEGDGSIKRLYRGVPLNCVRSMLSWGLITMTYEWLLTTTTSANFSFRR